MTDTIFALSSGAPPAGIAIVRVSGPQAEAATRSLAGMVPEPRRLVLRNLRDPGDGTLLDQALVTWFPGPVSATGEDLAEFHLHGGRAVVRAALDALGRLDGLRPAEPGEFTRRAFENGRIDLAQAEGLADLLAAETEAQRRAALLSAGGRLSRLIDACQDELLALAASVEALLDYGDEDDVGQSLPDDWHRRLDSLRDNIELHLAMPLTDRLRDGLRVVVAGPPNAGKSSLINALVGHDVAIVSPIPGTTRDVIEAPMNLSGIPVIFSDTAGLRTTSDPVEAIGVDRARHSLETADLILWLSDAPPPRAEQLLLVRTKCDLGIHEADARYLNVSGLTGEGCAELLRALYHRLKQMIPPADAAPVNARQASSLRNAATALCRCQQHHDPLIVAEELRVARGELDRITGRAGVEEMLDAMFARFCIGK